VYGSVSLTGRGGLVRDEFEESRARAERFMGRARGIVNDITLKPSPSRAANVDRNRVQGRRTR